MMKHAAIHGLRRRDAGVTLVELIAFIVIVAIVAVAMIQAFGGTMRGSHFGKEMTQATQLAQQRMEVILGQRKTLGYSGFDATTFDPCDGTGPVWGAQACTSTPNYGVASQFDNPACGANCRNITVAVTGPYGDTLATLAAQVWNY